MRSEKRNNFKCPSNSSASYILFIKTQIAAFVSFKAAEIILLLFVEHSKSILEEEKKVCRFEISFTFALTHSMQLLLIIACAARTST
jgi:hypothetical protein